MTKWASSRRGSSITASVMHGHEKSGEYRDVIISADDCPGACRGEGTTNEEKMRPHT
jgi:hypothetical protein